VTAASKRIRVEYYAQFREMRKSPGEDVATSAATAIEFYRELDARHPFGVTAAQVRIALNGKLVPWETAITDGDTVVFLTPFGGG